MPKYINLARTLTFTYHLDDQPTIQKMPTEAVICKEYNVSRQTVRCALKHLTDSGLLYSRQGSGYYPTGVSTDKKKNRIPVLLPSLEDYFYPRFIFDLKERLTQSHFDPDFIAFKSLKEERTILLDLLKDCPRAIIAQPYSIPCFIPNQDLYLELINNGTKVLFINTFAPPFSECIYINPDLRGGMELLINACRSKGHIHIGALLCADTSEGNEKCKTFLSCMKKTAPDVYDRHFSAYTREMYDNFIKNKDVTFIRDFITNNLPHCSAIICENEELVRPLIYEIQKAGFSIPDDCCVLCFSDDVVFPVSRILPTSVVLGKNVLSDHAATLILKWIKGIPSYSEEIPFYVSEGNSLGPFYSDQN